MNCRWITDEQSTGGAGCVPSGVRQLLPECVDDLDLGGRLLGRPTARCRPVARGWLLNMVVSIDGATAVAGRSGGLGGPADHTAFVHAAQRWPT